MIKQFLVILFAFTALNAQDGKSVLKDIQTKFSKIQDMSADVTQSSAKSKFYYKKENKYRIEAGTNIIVSDGNTIWNYNKKTNKVVLSRPEDTEMASTINNLVYSFPDQSKISYDGKEKIGTEEYNVLTMTPIKSSGSFNKIRIWSDNSNMIKRVIVTDRSGSSLVFEFSNIKINSSIPGSKFSFEAPKGSEIIDLR